MKLHNNLKEVLTEIRKHLTQYHLGTYEDMYEDYHWMIYYSKIPEDGKFVVEVCNKTHQIIISKTSVRVYDATGDYAEFMYKVNYDISDEELFQLSTLHDTYSKDDLLYFCFYYKLWENACNGSH